MTKLFWQRLMAVGMGGFFGGSLREAVALLVNVTNFPLSTLIINLTGTFLSAFLVVIWSKKVTLAQPVADFIMVGVLGAYTTYSTAILDMVKHGWLIGGVYILVRVIGGVIVVYLGRYLAEKVVAA